VAMDYYGILGVPRDATEPRRVTVVHLAGDRVAVPCAGRRDATAQGGGRPEQRLRESQRREDLACREAIERLAGRAPHDFPEQDRVQIGVDDSGSRAVDRRRGEHPLQRRGGVRLLIERQRGPQSGGVREQLAHGDAGGAVAVELRHVGAHRRVDLHGAALDEQHQGGRRRHDFREGGQVEQRAIGLDGRAARGPGEPPVSFNKEHGVRAAHYERGARVGPRADPGLDDWIEGGGVERRGSGRRCGRPGRGLEQDQRR